MTPKSRPEGKKKYTVRATIYKGKKKALTGKAEYGMPVFLAPQKQGVILLFQRMGKSRMPVYAIHTTSIPQMIENKTVSADIQEKLEHIAGYSHGAALAVLCHEYCMFHREDLADKIQSYGYGCPRVAWGILPKEVKQRFDGSHVIRNKKDLVTHLPPVALGYRHVGDLITIGGGSNGWIDPNRSNNYIAALEDVESETLGG